MKNRLAAIVQLALAMLAAAPALGRAQVDDLREDASEYARAEVAETRHRAAVALYARHRYRDAIDLFLEANRLRPSAALSFNVARCYEQLGDSAQALSFYRDYLRRADKPKDAGSVGRRVARLEQQLSERGVQQLSVLSTPPGAMLAIDGTSVGMTPWTGELAPGTHIVELSLGGYDTATRRMQLEPAHAESVELTLSQARPLPEPVAAAAPPAVSPEANAQADAHTAYHPMFFQPQLTRESEPAPTHTVVRPLPEAEHGSLTRSAGWIALGAGGAALGGALTFEVLRRGAEKDAKRETTQVRFADQLETMRDRQTAARVLGGIGAGLAALGGVLLLVSSGGAARDEGARVTLHCAPMRCRAALVGTF